jgi:hypothetical protein
MIGGGRDLSPCKLTGLRIAPLVLKYLRGCRGINLLGCLQGIEVNTLVCGKFSNGSITGLRPSD